MDTISGVLDKLNRAGQMMGEELDKQVLHPFVETRWGDRQSLEVLALRGQKGSRFMTYTMYITTMLNTTEPKP